MFWNLVLFLKQRLKSAKPKLIGSAGIKFQVTATAPNDEAVYHSPVLCKEKTVSKCRQHDSH